MRERFGGIGRYVVAIKDHVARGRIHEPRYDAGGCRFAASGLSDQTQAFAAFQFKTDVADGAEYFWAIVISRPGKQTGERALNRELLNEADDLQNISAALRVFVPAASGRHGGAGHARLAHAQHGTLGLVRSPRLPHAVPRPLTLAQAGEVMTAAADGAGATNRA